MRWTLRLSDEFNFTFLFPWLDAFVDYYDRRHFEDDCNLVWAYRIVNL